MYRRELCFGIRPFNFEVLFIEFNLERKHLWQEVLPDLQQHCLQYGIDIMFVDMLLGNQDGDPKTARELEEWTDEIERCYRESIGPFFLVIKCLSV